MNLITFRYRIVGVDTVSEGDIDGYSYLDATLKSVELEGELRNRLYGDYTLTLTPCNPGNGVSVTRDIRITSDGWVRFM